MSYTAINIKNETKDRFEDLSFRLRTKTQDQTLSKMLDIFEKLKDEDL